LFHITPNHKEVYRAVTKDQHGGWDRRGSGEANRMNIEEHIAASSLVFF
jgi:hypothetical protein